VACRTHDQPSPGKWKLRILTQLKHGPIRLSQLRKMLPDASKKMLTLHLRELEHDGIVVRSDLSFRRRHVEYSLETSLGAAVLHLIGTLAEWGSQRRRCHHWIGTRVVAHATEVSRRFGGRA